MYRCCSKWMMHGACYELNPVGCVSGHKRAGKRAVQMLTSSAVEVEKAARGEVHPLLALAVVIQGDLLRLHGNE